MRLNNHQWVPESRLRFKYIEMIFVVPLLLLTLRHSPGVESSLAMKRLYEDLFTDYNRLIVPVTANRTKVTITLGLKLGQLLDLNLKQQILSTNVWVEQTWYDHRLEWNPEVYGGIDMIHVPAENIWIPDIVLFNNADGNYELTLVAKAVLYANGTVVWKPPTMFRSTCEIDVEYFPFDIQTCFLRFGSWSYAGDEVEMKHVGNKRKVDIGIDLSQFIKNVEWDIIDVPAYYNENYYECCSEPFPDITFKIVIRRKMLFYLVNLILPVALMTFMTVSVFYLPADSNEKVTLSISILTSLIVFFLLMLEVIPPTSLAVPLFGKYLLFTLVLVSLSACVSVYSLNIYHRAPSVHQMSPRMRELFLKTLPRLLRLDRPDPRERSSLNRFRKKKIAQQILHARQHNKVYDLTQPLAASLNLIDTLQKSYTFNPKDDDISAVLKAKQNSHEEEEGRYFRRYVDNYISRLEANCGYRGPNKDNGPVACSCDKERNGSTSRGCCEHRKCCSRANKLMRQHSRNDEQTNQNCCSATTCNWLAPSGPTSCSFSNKNNKNNGNNFSLDQSTSLAGERLAGLHDDTFDMTFDYDDQDNILDAQSGHLTPPTCKDKSATLTEEELPSPPPPPRQLTQLSDSMKDLSGRLSSCSQMKLLSASHTGSMRMGRMDSGKEDEQQLVKKLISSINMINDASHDIDNTTTTTNSTTPTNDDIEYQQLKAMAHALNNNYMRPGQNAGPIYRTTRNQSTPQQQAARCTCREGPASNTQLPHQLDGSSKPNSLPSERQRSGTQRTGCELDSSAKPSELLLSLRLPYDQMPAHVRAAIRSILFIADTIKNEDDENSAIEDWESMSMVVDRLFLWTFLLLCTFGSLIILALAPSLYDQRDSIDDKLRIEIPASNCSALHQLS